MAAGMLPGLFKVQSLTDPDETANDALFQNLAALGPNAANAYTAYAGGRQAGQGAGQVAGAALGMDTRSPTVKNIDAINAAKAQVSRLGFNPDDPNSVDNFYKNVIAILQKQGLVAEAMAVAQEWHSQKLADANLAYKNADEERKAAHDQATQAAAVERNRILALRLGKMGDPVIQLLNQLDGTTDPLTRNALMARINALSKGMGVKVVDLGDHVQVVDNATGDVISDNPKAGPPLKATDQFKLDQNKQKIVTAYNSAKTGMQQQYDAAVDLYNMPGFDGIFGRLGRYIGEQGVAGAVATTLSSDATRAAYEKWKQVTGAVFLAGLNQLKQASVTGSTGLGQTSNIEGDKVQAAGAALGRSQDAGNARTQLRIYIQTLVTASTNIDAAAQREGITTIPLQQKPLTGPGTPTAAPVAPVTPPPAPVAPPASSAVQAPSGAATAVFERGPDGKIRRKQ